MSSSIITAFEVVKYGPVHPDYPTDYVCDHIQRKEQALFRKCYLGTSFYFSLLDALADYSEVSDYDAAQTYQQDDKVAYNGCILISLCVDNEVHPGDDTEKCWGQAPKFISDCLNKLWESNLRYWLAYEICLTSIDYSTYKLATHGATKQKVDGTGQETVTANELGYIKRKMRTDADEHLENMLAWMVEQTSDETNECSFSSITAVSDACADADCVPFSRRKQRRMFFKQ